MKKTIVKVIALAACFALTTVLFSACGENGASLTDETRDESGKASVNAPIPLSGFEDVTGGNKRCSYTMLAEITDTYTFTCTAATAITVKTPSGNVSGEKSVQADIAEGDTVTVTVQTASANERFLLNAQADNHLKRLPYEAHFLFDPENFDVNGDSSKAPEPTKIEYKKREGGTYVYLNNPEKLQLEDVGQAIQRNTDLHGDVQVTWEHSNYTGGIVYLGYQLKNDGDSDVYVTVTNIGYQVQGEWLGQQSWSDYYNYKFDLPEDYFTATGAVSEQYIGQDFIDYTPRVFQPTTYRIPAGEYIYVVGGTSKDAYNETNVADTADLPVQSGRCTNAVAKMFITGGKVTGTFYCYNNPEQVKAEPEQQGYITMRDGVQFGLQYKGVDYVQGLIESNPVFIVNDKVESGSSLPITYDVEYDKLANYRDLGNYKAFTNEKDTKTGKSWCTNINMQGKGKAVGTDMSSFECVTTDGETVTIDVNHTDGTGAAANLGNWMIDYHDNITLVNQGDKPRTFTINKSAHGALMAYVADREGNVLATKCTIIPLEGGPGPEQWEIYTVTVPPHTVEQFTVSFLLMGNSTGNVNHWITVD